MSRRSVPDHVDPSTAYLEQPLLPSDDRTPLLLRNPTIAHAPSGGSSSGAPVSNVSVNFDDDETASLDGLMNNENSNGTSQYYKSQLLAGVHSNVGGLKPPGGAVVSHAHHLATPLEDSHLSAPQSPIGRGGAARGRANSGISRPVACGAASSDDDLLPDPRRASAPAGVAAQGDIPQPPSHAPTPLPAIMAAGHGKLGSQLRTKRVKRVSNYVLGPLMGEGTFGHVRDALDLNKFAAERVAVKTIRRKHRSEAELRKVAAALENEVEHLQRYHHANIMRAADIFHRDGKDYMVLPVAVCSLAQLVQFRQKEISRRRMTFFSDRSSAVSGLSILGGGGGLSTTSPIASHRFSLGPAAVMSSGFTTSGSGPQPPTSSLGFTPRQLFPSQLVKDIIFQVLSALAYLHRQGVSHNDLKPANILLFHDGIVKLTDLGSCGTSYRGRGTPAFVSPQVAGASSKPVDGKKNDIWACGVVLFYLLTNMMPFYKDTEYALYEAIARADVNYDLIPHEEYDASSAAGPLTSQSQTSPNERVNSQRSTGSGSGGVGSGAIFAAGSFSQNPLGVGGAKHLLRLMLEKDEERRISASEALQHPWLSTCGAEGSTAEVVGTAASPQRRTSVDRSGGEAKITAAAGSVKKVVFNVRELATVVERDSVRHFQFVAEVATIAGLTIPSAIFRTAEEEQMDSDEDLDMLQSASYTEPTRVSVSSTGPRPTATTVAAPSSAGHGSRPRVLEASGRDAAPSIPRGTVYRSRFMGVEDLAHYGRKGRPECDVRSLRLDIPRRQLIHDYLMCLVALRGYMGRKKQRAAMGLPDDDDDETDDKKRKKCCVIC